MSHSVSAWVGGGGGGGGSRSVGHVTGMLMSHACPVGKECNLSDRDHQSTCGLA